ncbi:alpha/beta hydrolase [Acidovorax sp. SRB_14]|uniref:alpha/beta fold hydrolase n=1 Tax=unclassified Acidovorax TaxID=2684926 RepID=UPI00145CECCC|nr:MULTISPECIES: alpha/beta hydrolase [unclassified Acidovorax]NMM75834.1 alpha/beta hydrolase [Acidovorax sp. SRB_24]NMM81800.1 alpha/beta hydrolase [Acidovorax sp. SRB_14]NMM90036.1 alpha/beta hydrolase [Rhodococcus sp. SRB_17]
MSMLPTFTSLGSGAAVLMLHDADGGHLSFAPQVETLASAGYRAVAWDMPGYGHSAPIEPYGFQGLAQRCLALMDLLQPTTALTLVGHGLGAMLALEVALRHPARVRRMVLCAGGPPLDAAAVRDWVAPRLQALDAGHGMEQIAQTLVPQGIGPGALPEGVRLASHAMAQVHRATYRRALQALVAFDRRAAALSRLHLPVLLLGGAHDRCTPPEALQALAHVLPDARHASLPQVGHWPQLEDPDGFDAALLDFLARRRTLH